MHESNIPDNSQPDFSGTVEINNQQARQIPTRRIRTVVTRILSDYQFHDGEISIAIVDDRLMQQLNRQYLNHDYPTDVLSFVLDCAPDQGMLSGEIIVSADTAMSVASELGHSADDELLLYIIHGTLHLAGMNDKADDDRAAMIASEAKYLELLGIASISRDSAAEGDSQ